LRAGPRLVDLIDKMAQFKQATDIAANSAGATDRAFSEFTSRGTLGFKQFHAAVGVLKDDIGGALAPMIEGVTNRLKLFAERLAPIASAHPGWVKFLADAAAVSAVLLGVGGRARVGRRGLEFYGFLRPGRIEISQSLQVGQSGDEGLGGSAMAVERRDGRESDRLGHHRRGGVDSNFIRVV
jgi:hypothetical protein